MMSRAIFMIILLGIVNLPSDAKALDKISAFFLQFTLNEHGFEAGKPDGVIGPASRAALREFAEAYGAPSNPEDAVEYIIRSAITKRVAITDPEFLAKIEERVAENLRDPSSVQLREVYIHNSPSGKRVCGEVNGKNAYGGYAGFTPFYGTLIEPAIFIMGDIDGPDSNNFAQYYCMFSFPKPN